MRMSGHEQAVSSAGASHRNPLVTIGMAVHNGADFLAEAIASILGQTFRDSEVNSNESRLVLRRDGDASSGLLW